MNVWESPQTEEVSRPDRLCGDGELRTELTALVGRWRGLQSSDAVLVESLARFIERRER